MDTPNVKPYMLFVTTESINIPLKHFWESEKIDVPKCVMPDDAYCELLFVSTTTRQHGGQYEVYQKMLPKMPFAKNAPILGANCKLAINAFLNLKHCLSTNEEVHQSYLDFMKEYLKRGHMSPAVCMYVLLCHTIHCVFNKHDLHKKLHSFQC